MRFFTSRDFLLLFFHQTTSGHIWGTIVRLKSFQILPRYQNSKVTPQWHIYTGELSVTNWESVAASQPASGWPRASTLATYTSPFPPHMGPGSVRPAFQPRGRSTGQRSQFTCLIYISTYHPNWAVPVLWTAVRYCTRSYRYLYGVGRYVRVCTCTATRAPFLSLFTEWVPCVAPFNWLKFFNKQQNKTTLYESVS